jgi:hypothetical protein
VFNLWLLHLLNYLSIVAPEPQTSTALTVPLTIAIPAAGVAATGSMTNAHELNSTRMRRVAPRLYLYIYLFRFRDNAIHQWWICFLRNEK